MNTLNAIAWYGLFFAVVFHFIIHFVLSLKFKHYVPGLITSILFLPIGIYILYIVADMTKYSWETLCLTSIIGFIVGLANVVFLHLMMHKLSHCLKRFSVANRAVAK